MKVRTKITLLLFAVVGIFIAGLTGIKIYDSRKLGDVSAAREEERRSSFDDFLRHWSESLKTFVNDSSAEDGMMAAIERGDANWAEANLNDETLVSYKVHAIWAYKEDGTPAFSRNVLYSEKILEPPLPPQNILRPLLDQTHRCHFFAHTRFGLKVMEIYGAMARPPRTAGTSALGRGYLFVGHVWSDEDLHEMSAFTGNTIRFGTPKAGEPGDQDRPLSPMISFLRPLPGWDGQPVETLSVSTESTMVEQIYRSSDQLFLGLIAFAILLFLVLVISLTGWVSSPLKVLSTCLRKQDTEGLRPLQARHDEFGDFARLVGAFFEQRESLVREMAERRQTEQALHESEERLRHSQKMEAVGRLAGGIAHDFNNLLTAIIGYSEMIVLRSRDAKNQEEAGLIRKAGEQAAELTRQLLAFSRKQILQPRVIDLNDLVCEMKKLLRRVIGEQIDFRVEAAAECARICADPAQLQQVLLNLGVNARDAMPRGGVLIMRTGEASVAEPLAEETGALQPGFYVTLTVQDTGCGMDAETKARIFEPFFTTKSLGKGTGLGLATVYGVVNQSGGAVFVDSTIEKGTTFTIYLPRAEGPVVPPRAQAPKPEASRHCETILVIEDEEMVRELVCTVLSEEGYTILCTENGHEGLRMAREHEGHIDLLVSDVIMPQITGPEIARELLASRPKTKVLYISGYSDADISEDGVLSPSVQLLGKPFAPDALTRRVREVLDDGAAAGP